MAKPYPTGSVVPLGVCSSVHLFTFGAEMGLHRGVQALGYRTQASLLAVCTLLPVWLARA